MSDRTRRQQIEEMLEADPGDSFLRYALAMEYTSAGEHEAAAASLEELIRRDPAYVPAYQQAGQVLLRLGRDDQARAVLQAGVTIATRQGNDHAASEMSGLLAGLGG
jgi:tetratricopeptide (TPR) repeat protein